MTIGIDISQTAYSGTGVGTYVKNLVESLVKIDKENEYVLFFSSLRKNFSREAGSSFARQFSNPKVKIKTFRIPPLFLDFLWNKLHVFPIEWFIGDVDVFISSDWTQPPSSAKKVTVLYDLIVFKFPAETDKMIVDTQKRRLRWVKKECDAILCISQATKKDAIEILGIEEKRLHVVSPGI